jgi:hypothetical protein
LYSRPTLGPDIPLILLALVQLKVIEFPRNAVAVWLD